MKWKSGPPRKEGRYIAVVRDLLVPRPPSRQERLGVFGNFRKIEVDNERRKEYFVLGFKPDGAASIYQPENIVAHFGPIPDFKEEA